MKPGWHPTDFTWLTGYSHWSHRGQSSQEEFEQVYPCRWEFVQTWVYPPYPGLHKWWTMHVHHDRAPRRDMWESHRRPSSLVKSHSRRILLANHEGRLHKVRTTMQVVPTTCWLAQCAPRGVTIDPQPMAVSYLGDRHSRTIPFSGATDEVPCGCHWILYKVDRGRASCANHNPQDPTLCVEEHSMPIWNPKTLGVR